MNTTDFLFAVIKLLKEVKTATDPQVIYDKFIAIGNLCTTQTYLTSHVHDMVALAASFAAMEVDTGDFVRYLEKEFNRLMFRESMMFVVHRLYNKSDSKDDLGDLYILPDAVKLMLIAELGLRPLR